MPDRLLVRLSDGMRFDVDTDYATFKRTYQKALKSQRLIVVKNQKGFRRALNPQQIVYFCEPPRGTPVSESVDQLAEKVRTVLPRMSGRPHTPVAHLAASIEEVQEARTALDALLARLAEAERLQVRAEDRSHDQYMARKAAEAERDRLKAALEQIAALPRTGMSHTLAQRIARATLAADEGTE